jgi:hypothetical protein
MKKQSYPKMFKTVIQSKDGALLKKKWLFFKDFLPLEIDITSHLQWCKKSNLVLQNNLLKK